jgi:hypothetical protein
MDNNKLVESQILISQNMQSMSNTLQKINEQNILNFQKMSGEHILLLESMKNLNNTVDTLTKKYFWIVILIVMALICLAGAEKIVSIIPFGKL